MNIEYDILCMCLVVNNYANNLLNMCVYNFHDFFPLFDSSGSVGYI